MIGQYNHNQIKGYSHRQTILLFTINHSTIHILSLIHHVSMFLAIPPIKVGQSSATILKQTITRKGK